MHGLLKPPTALGQHVADIVHACSSKEVIGIAARRIVATMQSPAAIERSIRMREVEGDMARQRWAAIPGDTAIAGLVLRSSPRPASVRPSGNIDMRPESLFRRAIERPQWVTCYLPTFVVFLAQVA